MDTHANDPTPRAPVALALVILLVGVAAIALVTGWLAPTLDQYRTASAMTARSACNVCGVVEVVRELQLAGAPAGTGIVHIGMTVPASSLQTGGGHGEGAVILLGLLGGAVAGSANGAGPARAYETAVRLEDGSVRLLRDARAPDWKPGDRVKVIKGRIERIE